jgi:hypothetical protein
VEPTAEFAQLQLGFVDQTQRRYEVIRPLVLFADRTAAPRAQDTDTPPDTVRTLRRRFRQQGRRGLLPAAVEGVPRKRTSPIPEAVRQEIDRLKTRSDGVHDRELARLLCVTFGTPIDHKTGTARWQASPVACQGHLALWDYHAQPDRDQARRQVIQRYDRGWDKVSISRFWHVSRPTVDAWIPRVETEPFAGRVDRRRAPQTPVRQMWRPLMGQVSHLQNAHPDAGAFRIWSLRARSEVSGRTIGRVMARNKVRDDDIPHVPTRGVTPTPGPHPDNASHRHPSWCMDGRRMDCA